MAKKEVKLFVSYARANKKLARRFFEKFCEVTAPSKRYKYIFWQDTEILVGENWHAEIQKALEECDLGLLLISPAFLGSQYITEEELPQFVGDSAKPLIPVLLQPVDFEYHDLKGLEESQIFMLETTNLGAPKAYGQCSTSQRYQFVMNLFRQVEKRLKKLFKGE
jgi:hypothetical protein